MAALTENRSDAKWRQIAVVDAAGRTAAFHGDEIYSWHGHAAADGAIAIGNILRSEAIPQAMLDAFLDDPAEPMQDRLVAALAAGLAAGGELDPLGSAALLIVRDDAFAWMDLRVDRSTDPIGDLAALAGAYAPDAEGTRMRAIDPDSVPNNLDLMRRHAALQKTA